MIFDEIVLHNFGVYLGRHRLALTPPDAEHPIILFGGLNGAGKTTLLDGMQLGLYGKLAHSSNRGTLSYDEYLRRCINRSVDPREGAAIEIAFQQSSEGQSQRYRIHRSWSENGKGIRERIEVLRNGKLDQVLTESWAEYVEQLIPSRIAHLFFFDGEKIEGFADLHTSATLLETAVHSLLGLDLVDRLTTDLIVLERRKRKDLKPEAEQPQLEEAVAAVEHLVTTRGDLVLQRGAAQNDVDRAEKLLREAETRFRQAGGELFERRKELEAQRSNIEQGLRNSEERLREITEGAAPLLFVQDIVQRVDERDQQEESAAQARILANLLSHRDSAVLKQLKASKLAAKTLSSIENFLTSDRRKRAAAAAMRPYLGLSPETREHLRGMRPVLIEIQHQLLRTIRETEELSTKLFDIDRQLAGVPSDEMIARILEVRDNAIETLEDTRSRMAHLDGELERIKRELDQKQATLTRQIEQQVDQEFEHEDATRVIVHAQRIRETLHRFRANVVSQHVANIQEFVLDSFRRLARKQSLVTSLRINPEHFTVELRDEDDRVIPPETLSAGERQLLAVALLWGLGRASGRPLPAVIDTPLGRLDSEHRTHLIERYFPHASHQVLLLSTDEEITAEYFEKLRPWVGRSYRLAFDDQTRATKVEEGYFWETEAITT